MKPEDLLFRGQRHEIPTIFYDTVEERPIEECKICGKALLTSDEPYVIEKAFKQKEVLFEYAMCMDCANNMRQDMSKDSMQRIEQFMLQNGRFQDRFNDLRYEDFDTDKWLNNCIITNQDRDEQEEYQIQGIFMGDQMVSNQFPYMISGEAMEQMQELLSPETRGEIDRFKDEFFDLPPELADLFKDPKYILVR